MRGRVVLAAGIIGAPACVDVPYRDFATPAADARIAADAAPRVDGAADVALHMGFDAALDHGLDAALDAAIDAGGDAVIGDAGGDAVIEDAARDVGADAMAGEPCGRDGVFFEQLSVCLHVETYAGLASHRAGHTLTRMGSGDAFALIGGDRGPSAPAPDAPAHGPPVAESLIFVDGMPQVEAMSGLARERSAHHAAWIEAHGGGDPAPDHLLVLGGRLEPGGPARNHVAVWDSITGVWEEPAEAMREPRLAGTATPLPDGHVLLVGGERGHDEQVALAGNERYLANPAGPPQGEPPSRAWAAHSHNGPSDPAMPATVGHMAAALGDGRVMWGGGRDIDRVMRATWIIYDAGGGGGGTLEGVFDGPAVADAEVVTLGEPVTDVLLYGGRVGEQAVPASHRYDVATGVWRERLVGLDARLGHTATRVGPDDAAWVLVIGGAARPAVLLVDERDPGRLRFEEGFAARGPLAQVRSGHRAAWLADGRVVVTGGRVDGAPTADLFVITLVEHTP